MKANKFYIVEYSGTLEGNKAAVLFYTDGFRRGYVAVNKEHPFYGMHWQDPLSRKDSETILQKEVERHNDAFVPIFETENTLNSLINVHGSLTYAAGSCDYPIKTSQSWWFGFDCNHCHDAIDLESRKTYFPVIKIDSLFQEFFVPSETRSIRSLEYCKEECLQLSRQLNYYNTLLKKNR